MLLVNEMIDLIKVNHLHVLNRLGTTEIVKQREIRKVLVQADARESV